ncbi:MAG: hypothetical protein ACRDKW_02030 [Actinomycetota bacterium]
MEDVREDRLELITQDPIPLAPPTQAADPLRPAPAGFAGERKHPWAVDFELPEVLRSGRMPGRWDEDED